MSIIKRVSQFYNAARIAVAKKGGRISRPAFTLCLALALTAPSLAFMSCGSLLEDNAKENSSTPSGIEYKGKTTKVKLSADNAETMIFAVSGGASIGGGAASSFSKPSLKPYERILNFYDLRFPLFKTETSVESGSCGGSNTITMTVDEEAKTLSGKYVFDDFCDNNETQNGTFTIRGSYATDSAGNMTSMTMTMSTTGITTESAEETYSFSGSFSFSNTETSMVLTLNTVIDTIDGIQVKLNQYKTSMTLGSAGQVTETSISGDVYHSDYGYVTISTTTPLKFSWDGTPSQGVIIYSGSDNTSVKLTVQTGGQCKMEVDENGDGDYADAGESLGNYDWYDLQAGIAPTQTGTGTSTSTSTATGTTTNTSTNTSTSTDITTLIGSPTGGNSVTVNGYDYRNTLEVVAVTVPYTNGFKTTFTPQTSSGVFLCYPGSSVTQDGVELTFSLADSPMKYNYLWDGYAETGDSSCNRFTSTTVWVVLADKVGFDPSRPYEVLLDDVSPDKFMVTP
ncbi:MAG: hypothetical protein OEY64_08060 [Nitrospinota bacterium]|nr:hypothetical protein [Nitrospinota bacterium]